VVAAKVMYMHDIWQMDRISRSCQSSYWGFVVGVWDKCIMPPE